MYSLTIMEYKIPFLGDSLSLLKFLIDVCASLLYVHIGELDSQDHSPDLH